MAEYKTTKQIRNAKKFGRGWYWSSVYGKSRIENSKKAWNQRAKDHATAYEARKKGVMARLAARKQRQLGTAKGFSHDDSGEAIPF